MSDLDPVRVWNPETTHKHTATKASAALNPGWVIVDEPAADDNGVHLPPEYNTADPRIVVTVTEPKTSKTKES